MAKFNKYRANALSNNFVDDYFKELTETRTDEAFILKNKKGTSFDALNTNNYIKRVNASTDGLTKTVYIFKHT